MPPITISLSPNTERDDLTRAAATLAAPWRWYNQQYVHDATASLEQLFPDHQAVFVQSGRAALTAALTALGIGSGDEVIIQAFTCLAVPQAVQRAGAVPVYADISPVTYNLDPTSVESRITPNTRALIIQHTFGIPAELTELQAIARKHNLPLIEDAAHALGGTHDGQPLGTFSDAAILSFGRDKCFSSVFGGAVVSRNRDLINTIREAEQKKPRAPRWWIAQQLLHPLALSFVTPLYFTAGIGKVALVLLQKLNLLSKAVTADERAGRAPAFLNWQYPPALARLASLQLKKLSRFTAHRRRIAHRYLQALAPSSPLHVHVDRAAWLRFPLRIDSPAAFLRAARQQHMLLGDWYTSPVAPCNCTSDDRSITGYQPGSCPVAEQAAQHTINLPTYIRLTDKQVQKVIDFTAKYI